MVTALRALGIGLVGLAACYDPPQPYCGFYCGPNGLCPDGYACNGVGICRLEAAPASVTCLPDGGGGSFDATPFDGFPDADTTQPTIVATSPQPNDINVSRQVTLTVSFSEPVFDVNTGDFSLWDASTPLAGTIQAVGSLPDFTLYQFTPSALLPATTTITVVLTNQIHDGAGNALATAGNGMVTFMFTTGS